MDSLLIAGASGLGVAFVGFGLALRTKDWKAIAIAVSLLGVAILLYVSQWQDNHVARDMLHQDSYQRVAIERKLEALLLLLRMVLE